MKDLKHPVSVSLLFIAIANVLCFAYMIPNEYGFYLGIPITMALVLLSFWFFEDD